MPAAGRWIDISAPLHNGMVGWPGDPPLRIEPVSRMERGDAMNLSAISASLHVGTHMDAPRHCLRNGMGLDEMPLEATVGPARLIRITHPRAVTLAELAPHRPRRGERLLFKTRNSSRFPRENRFFEDFVYISSQAAEYLAQRGVRAVGLDYLSVDGFHVDQFEAHKALLGAGIWIMEGLDLSKVKPGRYDLVCLPLRVVGADGAPARAILRPRSR